MIQQREGPADTEHIITHAAIYWVLHRETLEPRKSPVRIKKIEVASGRATKIIGRNDFCHSRSALLTAAGPVEQHR